MVSRPDPHSATLGSEDFYQKLLEYFEEIGGYRTVWELAD